MPPLPPAPSTMAVIFKFSYGTDLDVVTKLFAHYAGGAPSAADCATCASFILTNAGGPMASEMHSSVVLNEVEVIDLASALGNTGVATGAVTGNRAGQELDAATCVLLNQTVQRRYRGGKPRKYWPWGVAADLATPQTWSSSAQSSFQSTFNAIEAAMFRSFGSLTLDYLVNVSYYQGSTASITGEGTDYARGHTKSTVRPTTATVDRVLSSTINIRPGSQRRRLHPG